MNKNSYKDLIVWQKATDVALLTYEITKKFPKDEIYGLTSQMRRAAVSIPSNIAEGKMRGYTEEWKRFLLIAYGSAAELETQIEIAQKLGLIDAKNYARINEQLQEVMKMLNVMSSPSSAKSYRLSPIA